MEKFSWGLNFWGFLSIFQNKIRIQTSHRAASSLLQSNQPLKASRYMLWAHTNPKLCPQYFKRQGSLFLPSAREATCAEGPGHSEARQGRAGTPAHPAARSPQRLAGPCCGLPWKTSRTQLFLGNSSCILGLSQWPDYSPSLQKEFFLPPFPLLTPVQRTHRSKCAVSEEVSTPHSSQPVGKSSSKHPFQISLF